MEKPSKARDVVQANNPTSEPHPAVILVTAYVVEKGLILPPTQVEFGSNEITALPQLIKDLALLRCSFCL